MRRHRNGRRRAVSTVISNLMMITITLSLAAILIAWTGSTYGLFTGGAQIFYNQRGQAVQERFVVEDAFFDHTLSQCGSSYPQACLLLYVRNVGAEQINVTAIYVNGTTLQLSPNPLYCTLGGTPPSVMITVGSVCEFTLNFGSSFPNLPSGSLFYIVVASSRGNRATFTVRTPCYLNRQYGVCPS